MIATIQPGELATFAAMVRGACQLRQLVVQPSFVFALESLSVNGQEHLLGTVSTLRLEAMLFLGAGAPVLQSRDVVAVVLRNVTAEPCPAMVGFRVRTGARWQSTDLLAPVEYRH